MEMKLVFLKGQCLDEISVTFGFDPLLGLGLVKSKIFNKLYSKSHKSVEKSSFFQ